MTDPFASLEDDLTELRADFGYCRGCGERCYERPVEWEHHRYHQGCRPVGRCQGCFEPIKPLDPVAPDRLIHDTEDCRKALERHEKVRKAREEAAKKRAQQQRLDNAFHQSSVAFHASMIATARSQPVPVVFVTLAKDVIDTVNRLANSHPHARKAMNGSRQGTVRFDDATGSITVFAYTTDDTFWVGRGRGWRLCIAKAVMDKHPEALAYLGRRLHPQSIAIEGDKESHA